MSLLNANGLQKSYGPQVILRDVSLNVEAGERIGLVGSNGSGKSTLARILAGFESADAGDVVRRGAINFQYLSQEPVLDLDRGVSDQVMEGLAHWTQAKRAHEAASERLSKNSEDTVALDAQSRASFEIERLGGWELEHRADTVLEHLGLSHKKDARVGTLSGGEKRRVALAQILVSRPSLAILDEPTNHLDIATIEWLESFLVDSYEGALLLITHDRYVLDRVVQKTWELDRGELHVYSGGYESYLAGKAERLGLQQRAEDNRQNFLRRELEWLRRQPKARTTKSQARIDRAEAARAQEKPRGEKRVNLVLGTTRSGKTIVDFRDVDLEIGGKRLVRGFNLMLTQGERIGIVGPNGAGKTTLLRAVMQQLAPTRGEIVVGQNTQIAYFDQTRSGLEDSLSIFDNVAEGKSRVTVAGQTMDTRSWLERFLFDPKKQTQLVGALSGGERARVALAKLLLKPANLLLFDEPTNDLDVTTLSALEELLVETNATSLVVTHDRYFLDRIATGILSFEPDARVVKYEGNYGTYVALRPEIAAAPLEKKPIEEKARAPRNRRAITYGERIELEKLPTQIESIDAQIAQIERILADGATYADPSKDVSGLVKELEAAKEQSAKLLARWEELELKKEEENAR